MDRPRYRLRLFDLAAAIVIVVILIGLLLPAMQIGGSRRRSECASRLGELAKAMQQFELAKKRYPGYLEAFGEDASGSCKIGTWAVALLPYVEQEPLYDIWNDPSTTPAWNLQGGFAKRNELYYPTIRLFMCPDDDAKAGLRPSSAPNSYVCNAGLFPAPLPSNYSSLGAHEIAQRSTRPENGVFSNQLPQIVSSCYTGGTPMAVLGSRATKRTTSKDIRDGLTQTLAFTENLQADHWGYVGKPGPWSTTVVDGVAYAGDDLHPDNSPRVHIGFVWLCRTQPEGPGAKPVGVLNKIKGRRLSSSQGSVESARPSSAHSGIVNVAMLGGSVLTLSDQIDYRVYQALMTPHTAQSDVPDKTYVLKEADYVQ